MYNILSHKSRSTNKFSLFATENICFIDWGTVTTKRIAYVACCCFVFLIIWLFLLLRELVYPLLKHWLVHMHGAHSAQCPVSIQWQNEMKNYYLRIPIDGKKFIRFAYYMRAVNHPCVCQSKEFSTHNSKGGGLKNWFQCNAILSLYLYVNREFVSVVLGALHSINERRQILSPHPNKIRSFVKFVSQRPDRIRARLLNRFFSKLMFSPHNKQNAGHNNDEKNEIIRCTF